jgi:hypothetical protein
MSFRAMLRHRVTIKRVHLTQVDGLSTENWTTVAASVPAFVDLVYIRAGKDPMWTPEAGRPAERTGVVFMLPTATVRSGDRLEVTIGPPGTFEVEGAQDYVWTPQAFHHYELGVKEVGSPLAPNNPSMTKLPS